MSFEGLDTVDTDVLAEAIQEWPEVIVSQEAFDRLVKFQAQTATKNPRLVFRRDGAVRVGDTWVVGPKVLAGGQW